MERKKEIENLLEVLNNLGWSRKRIEGELKYNNNYISQALSRGGNNILLANLKRLLENINLKQEVSKPSLPGDEYNRERALIKVMLHRIIKLEAERLGMSEEKVKAELEKDTNIALSDLENGQV